MTEKQKKIAIVIGVVLIAIMLLWSRKTNASIIVNQQGLAPIDISIPGFNIPERGGINITIPALPSRSQYGFNAISPCMCNGASTVTSAPRGPMVEFVTNLGNSGPNIYGSGLVDSRNDGIANNASNVFNSTGSYFYTPGG